MVEAAGVSIGSVHPGLQAEGNDLLSKAIVSAVKASVLHGVFIALEARRLERLARALAAHARGQRAATRGSKWTVLVFHCS